MMPPFSSDQPHTILIATSSAYDHVALGKTLGRCGYDVRAVSRGDEALAVAGAGGVAMAVLDAALAGSAGLELCQRLHQLCGPNLPIYILSNSPSQEERERAREVGAAAYLPLSFNADDLAENILLRLKAIPAAPVAADLPVMSTLEVNYHTMLSGSPDAILLLQRGSYRILDVNRRARELFGLTETELVQTHFPSLCPPSQPDGRPSPQVFAEHVGEVMAGGVQVFELTMWHSSGRSLCCELRMVPLNSGQHRLMHVRVVGVTRRKLAEALRDGKNRLLEMIAHAAPLGEILTSLMLLIESQSDDVLCTAMLLAPDGVSVQVGAGPSMPPEYLAAIEGLPIGPAAGSCGTAIHRKETVVVADIMNDPLWIGYREAAAQYGLRACWSMPIMLDSETVLGSFAMYYREVRTPSDEDLSLIGAATYIAGIAIVRTRREEELRRHREHLEELVAARTAELLQAKEEAEHINEELSTALDNLSMTQEELVRRDKLAALGALVAGVAHELNTPIGNSLVMASSMSERTAELRRDMEAGLRRSVLESYLVEAASADEVVVRNLRRAAALVANFKHIAVGGAGSQRALRAGRPDRATAATARRRPAPAGADAGGGRRPHAGNGQLSGAAQPGAAQPDRKQRRARLRQPRPGHDHAVGPRRRQRRNHHRGRRHGRRHPGGQPAAHLRSLLHHAARLRRLRAGPVRHAQHRHRRAGRTHRRQQHRRPGRALHLAAAQGGAAMMAHRYAWLLASICCTLNA